MILTVTLAAAMAGCGSPKAAAPAMEPLPAPEVRPVRKNWVEKTGDATWNTVAVPLQALGNRPKPKQVGQPLTPTEAPALVIVTRGGRGAVTAEEGATTTAASTAPATQP